MDRTEAARAVAKVCAYVACGKLADAKLWADRLRAMLASAGV